MHDSETLSIETPDLWADLREQTADFQAGVQEVFHELEAMRQTLAEKEEAVEFQSELVAEQLGQFTQTAAQFESLRAEIAELVRAGNATSDDENPLIETIENHLARFDSQFNAAIGSLDMIPSLCKREELLDSEIVQLREELTQAAAQYEATRDEQQELVEDLAAERERSARLEATLAATERELTQQRKLVAEELSSIRQEIERQKPSQDADPVEKPAGKSALSEADESTDDASGKPTSQKRSRRRRKSR